MKRLYAIRGAITCKNTASSIKDATQALCKELFQANSLKACDIVSVQFSLTQDLNAMNPCTALRQSCTGLDTSTLALFCTQEATTQNMLPQTIRVLVSAYMEEGTKVIPIYLEGAKALRPDLAKN